MNVKYHVNNDTQGEESGTIYRFFRRTYLELPANLPSGSCGRRCLQRTGFAGSCGLPAAGKPAKNGAGHQNVATRNAEGNGITHTDCPHWREYGKASWGKRL